jgi:hypothetical protein
LRNVEIASAIAGLARHLEEGATKVAPISYRAAPQPFGHVQFGPEGGLSGNFVGIGCKNAGRRGTKFSCAIAWLGIVKNRWPREPIGIAEAIASSGHDDNFPCCFVNDAALNRPQFVSERDLAKPSKGKYP